MTLINETPDDWEFPLSNWFDNMLNNPRKIKRIIVKDESPETKVFVFTPSGYELEMPEAKVRDYDALGLSLRRKS